MLRKLLACLALLTGLTAAGVTAPANAAVILSTSVESTMSGGPAQQPCASSTANPSPRSTGAAKSLPSGRTRSIVFRVPSVYLGCDRTRE